MLFDFHNKNSGIKGNYREAGKLFLFDKPIRKVEFYSAEGSAHVPMFSK